MATKKTTAAASDKSSSKKKTEAVDSKSNEPKRVMRKKYNEFGDKDGI